MSDQIALPYVIGLLEEEVDETSAVYRAIQQYRKLPNKGAPDGSSRTVQTPPTPEDDPEKQAPLTGKRRERVDNLKKDIVRKIEKLECILPRPKSKIARDYAGVIAMEKVKSRKQAAVSTMAGVALFEALNGTPGALSHNEIQKAIAQMDEDSKEYKKEAWRILKLIDRQLKKLRGGGQSYDSRMTIGKIVLSLGNKLNKRRLNPVPTADKRDASLEAILMRHQREILDSAYETFDKSDVWRAGKKKRTVSKVCVWMALESIVRGLNTKSPTEEVRG